MASVCTIRSLLRRGEGEAKESSSSASSYKECRGVERRVLKGGDASDRETFERLAKSRAKIQADKDPASIESIGTYAVLLATLFRDETAEAERYFDKVLQVYESASSSTSTSSSGSPSSHLAPAYCMYATSYASFALHTQKNPTKAARILEGVLKVDPKHPAALGDLAMLKHMYQPHDTEMAEGLYEKAVALYPEHATVVGAYANFVKTVRNDVERSERLFRRALDVAPDHPQCLGNFAVLLHGSLGRHDEAETHYERAIKADDADANNYGNYALFLTEVRKKHDEAERLYNRAIEIDPKHSNSLYNYGVFAESIRNDRARAETLYRRAVESDPRHVFARHALASLLDDMRKNPEEAETHFQAALELAPADILILNDYAAYLTNSRGLFKKAVDVYRKSLEADDSQIDARYNLAYLLKVKCGKPREAADVLDMILERNPSHATAMGLLANIRAGVGETRDVEAALKLYARACALEPTNATNLSNYAQCLHRKWKAQFGGPVRDEDDETSAAMRQRVRELYERATNTGRQGGKHAPPNAYYNFVSFLLDDEGESAYAVAVSARAMKVYPRSKDLQKIHREAAKRASEGG